MTTNYIGITIGPIYSTMELTSSPAGLWGASYLFSTISRELCVALVEEGIPAEKFLAPFFLMQDGKLVLSEDSSDICEVMRKKGVGLFHDRIIFCADGVENAIAKINNARERVLNELAVKLSAAVECDCADWLKRYFRILATEVSVETGNSPLVEQGKVLSALELEPQFPVSEKYNHLLSLFENPINTSKNAVLKDSFLRLECGDEWMLFRNQNSDMIRDLTVLANQYQKVEKKYQQYYAVLKSDGDSMGKILQSRTSDEEIRAYSRKCLTFCAEAAQMVQSFGGMPIYAGGDDLMVLLPVVGQENKSIFALIEELRKQFNKVFESERENLDGKPTISFGVAIQYYKSPLYEALERADTMLRRSKSTEDKNACYLSIQKHSGQTFELFETKMDAPEQNLFSMLDELYQQTCKTEDNDGQLQFLSGAGYQIENHHSMFYMAVVNQAARASLLKNLFDNLFDNADQKQFKPYLEKLNTLTYLIFDEQEGKRSMADQKRCVDLTSAAIRTIHFMNEKKEED